MEKQLLFLLDFDLRIDNDNLNEAAAAFFVEPKASLPLTPTTPTFRSAQHPQHAGALESASASASAAATTSNAPEHAVARAVASTNPTNNLPAHYNHYQEQQKTASKVYPPTLGLSGSNSHRVQPVAPISDAASIAVAKEMEDTRNAAAAYQQSHGRTHSVSSMDMTTGGADMSAHAALSASHKLPSQTMRLPSQAKRQHSHESASSSSSGSLPKAGVSSSHVRDGDSGPAADMNDPKYSSNSGSNSRSSVDPLQQLSASEKLSLRPSPKKRAVSRGHHSNIPHPSPVYYCQFSGYQASSAAPSSSSSSMCSLAPLELVSYSSMRYQQQRYDPFASRGPASGSGRHHPRMAASIPSLRAPTSTSSSTSTSPYGSGQCEAAIPYFASTKGSGGGCSLGASTRKDKRTLRHQCTLPDISSRCEEYTLATAAATVSSRIPSTASTPLPAPPPVRLVSSTYEMESSPVATLVYNQSPALAHPTFGSSAGTAANNRRQGIGIASVRTKTSSARIGSSSSTHHPPVMALSSLSVNSQRSQMACEPANALLPESTSNSGSIVPFPALDDCGDDGDSGVLPSWRSHAHSDEDSQSGASSSAGGGWQLKSKILHPLSNWFRSSKQTNSSGNLSHHRRRPSNPAQSPSLCARDEASASLLSRTCNPRRFHQGKDVASARRAPFSKAPDSAMVCSSSPMYLGQQFHATPAAKPGSAAGC
ncbi:hypothetical protein GGI12_005340 [Dipsacomyces acuminosporus]|nr:hypothetical protein GGI12_005340 [Dipsacomyces acuminosporus]